MSVDINDNTPKAVSLVTKLSAEALGGFVEKARTHTKVFAPRDTGEHAGHIDTERISPVHYTLFSSKNYGAYLEFGTSRMPAQPHFRPGLQKAVSDYQRKGLWGD